MSTFHFRRSHSNHHQFAPSRFRWLHSPLAVISGKILIVFFWLLLWQISSGVISKPLLLPSPITVFERLFHLIRTIPFWHATLSSFLRVIAGIVTGIAIGTLFAVLTARSRTLSAFFKPLITMIKSTPVASFIILVNLWLDHNALPIFISFLMVFPVVWANVEEGIRAVAKPHLALSRVYRLPKLRIIRRIYIPTVKPYFASACRSSLGLAWKAGIAAEVLVPSIISIGKQLYESKLYLETTDLFAWTLVVIVFSLIAEGIAEFLLRRSENVKRKVLPEVTNDSI